MMPAVRFVLNRVTSARGLASLVALVAAWCALWGTVSAANVLSGLVVALVVSVTGMGATGSIRPVPLVRLIWLVACDLVVSTVVVVREVLTPTDYTDEAILAVELGDKGRRHLLLFYVAITITPGTAVVAAESDATLVYLHVLHADRFDEVERHVSVLLDVADEAFPPSSSVAEPVVEST